MSGVYASGVPEAIDDRLGRVNEKPEVGASLSRCPHSKQGAS